MVQYSSRPTTVDIPAQVARQRHFFQQGQTRSLEFRRTQLRALKAGLAKHQDHLLQALQADLRKPRLEGVVFDLGVTLELDYTLKRLQTWMRPQAVPLPWLNQPAQGQIYPEPLGVVLIISPWNYPVQLTFAPLIGAIAAGNCTLLKPSEFAPHTAEAIATLVADTFDPDYVAVVTGDVATSQALLAEKFDHIFFTGSTAVGREVMKAAAAHLTPVTLELGGKSPCIVTADVDIEVAARRIAWGKFINAGQTCVAPDYLWVDRRIKPELLAAIQRCITEFYGPDPALSPDYGRIINEHHATRLAGLMQGDIVIGGQVDLSDRYIAPTVIDQVQPTDPIMAAEIFGPILPVLTYTTLAEAIADINQRPKPLALYIFTRDRATQDAILQTTSSGGVCCNDTILHIAPPTLPFGGVGPSGLGAYHGRASFDTFSHYKSVLRKPFWLRFNPLYPPYGPKLSWLQRLLP